MDYQKTIEKIAHRELTPQELADFTRDQWGMICAYIVENRTRTRENEIVKLLQTLQDNIAIEMKETEETVHPLNMDVQNIINNVQNL